MWLKDVAVDMFEVLLNKSFEIFKKKIIVKITGSLKHGMFFRISNLTPATITIQDVQISFYKSYFDYCCGKYSVKSSVYTRDRFNGVDYILSDAISPGKDFAGSLKKKEDAIRENSIVLFQIEHSLSTKPYKKRLSLKKFMRQ